MVSTTIVVLVFFSTFVIGSVQNTSSPQAIADTCYEFLWSHLEQGDRWGMSYFFFRPSLTKYSPSQWLWDSGCHMTVWSHRNVTNSILDLQTMLKMQQPNGFIPEISFWGKEGLEGEIWNQLSFGNQRFALITQTPVLGFSLQRIAWAAGMKAARPFLKPLLSYFEWWIHTRDPTQSGLVSAIHSWETGMDASPAYDEAYYVSNPQPKYLQMYPRFVELLLSYDQKYRWNMEAILNRNASARAPLVQDFFLVEDTMVNSVLAASLRLLSQMASALNETDVATTARAHQLSLEKSIISLMWNSTLNRFASARYKGSDGLWHQARAETAQSLFPLLLETLPQNMVNSIVQTQVTNSSRFWLPYPIPSVAASDPSFQPVYGSNGQGDLLWRGPVWPIQNFFVIEGLLLHNQTSVAKALLQRWIALYEKTGVWEHYNPLTGDHYGEEGLGMSTLIVDSLFRLGVL